MKKQISVFLVLAILLSLLAGCSQEGTNPGGTSPSGSSGAPADVDFSQTDEDMFTERDRDASYDAGKAVTVRLSGNSASASSDSVQINGSTVILKEEATYIISGELTDGMLVVDAPETAKLQLVFNGVRITSQTCAALYILEADKVFLTLAEGSDNSLINGGSFSSIDENNIDGVLFSKQDLTLNGAGSLTVTSPAGHGIVCKDDLVITGGSYVIHTASHGLDANDSVRIAGADLTVDAGKDAIHCENSEDTSKGFVYISGAAVKAEAEGDGIAASGYLQIASGTIDLTTGGGSENGNKTQSDHFGGFMGGGPGGMGPGDSPSTGTDDGTSMKGLKSGNSMLISGGDITVNSADDSVHSDVSLTVNGGTFTVASGDDAFHAEDTLIITAGVIRISESYEGLEALHIDVRGGDIQLAASDDGLNAAGGTDQSGTEGGRDGMFGGPGGRPGGGRPGGGMGGGNSANSGGSVKISGGTLYIRSSGDGIDANGTLEITGGHTTVVGPTQGDTATLDYDISATISGGTFIGTGAYGMAQTFSDSQQGVVAVSVGNRPAGTQITLKDAQGNTLITCQPELNFAVVILSAPEIKKGETYTIVIGSDSGDFKAS